MAKKVFQRIERPATAEERKRHAAMREQVVNEFPPAAGAGRKESPPGIPSQIRQAREARGLTGGVTAGAVSADVKKLLSDPKIGPGIHTLSNGMKFMKATDGTITPVP